MAKIGVLGYSGRLGSVLVKMGCDPIDVDITDKESVRCARLNDWDVIINCAAITDVDGCQHPAGIQTETYKKAVLVNSRALEHIRSFFSGKLIHISTDYVFKGDKGPYKESDKRNPVNDYGFTKYGGEVVLETFPWETETLVVRTTGLFGAGRDFASTLLDFPKQGGILLASKELRGNHTYVPHLVEALLEISQRRSFPEEFSYLHIGSVDIMTRYEFAILLASEAGYSTDWIRPCRNTEIAKWVAPRPTRGGVLVNKAISLDLPMYETKQGIQKYLESLQ